MVLVHNNTLEILRFQLLQVLSYFLHSCGGLSHCRGSQQTPGNANNKTFQFYMI
jgi:hypothetical protein